MSFDPGLQVNLQTNPLGFQYSAGVFGPAPELRSLDALRPTLLDPSASGPDPVYAIVMDVGRDADRRALESHMLLFGLVTYAQGRIGDEPVRSQGHIHRVSQHSGWRPPEVYEIWAGAAYVYMQERGADDPGRCYAILGRPGDIIIVPPGWAHATVSADPAAAMTFGALCDREYGFEYGEVRKRRGLAWHPVLDSSGAIDWRPNPCYRTSTLEIRGPSDYIQFGIEQGHPLYLQATNELDRFQWVSKPGIVARCWQDFVP